jgi:hypothetical protein
MRNIFHRVVVIDFEYEVIPAGSLPAVLCMVAYILDGHLQHIQIIRLWRGEFGPHPPFDIGDDTLVVGYSLWAELTCFLVLGWEFPTHVYDLHTAYLAVSNFLLPKEYGVVRKKISKKLSDACKAYGIEGWEDIEKPQMAKDIGEGRWYLYGQPAVFAYCEEDVKNSTELLRRQLRGSNYFGLAPIHGIGLVPSNPDLVLHWSEYSAKAIARVQARGMRIDLPLWNLVQENKTEIIKDLVRRFDPSQGTDDPIYTNEGEFEYTRFARWLISRGIPWPRLPSGQLDIDEDAFGLMMHIPGISGLYLLKTSLFVIRNGNLPIGPDGFNRPSLFPFGTATGRNAHGKSLFNAHAAMRSFIKFAPDKIGLYLDWRTQEIGIAAKRSGDEDMMDAYRRTGDFYHGFALDAGLTDDPNAKHWKEYCGDMRDRMKTLCLGIGYGMGVPSIARKLDRHPLIASGLLELHRRKYPKFWEWREQQMWQAKVLRRMEADDGWPLLITTSPNRNTLYNFPMQSGGAVMLRETTIKLCEAGLVPSMLVHDGIVFELDNMEQVEQAKTIMANVGTEVCDGFQIGVGVEQLRQHGERFRDKRGKDMWDTIIETLIRVGAIKNKEEAA